VERARDKKTERRVHEAELSFIASDMAAEEEERVARKD